MGKASASASVEAEVAIVEVVGGDKHLEATGGDWQRSLATLRQEVRGRQWERCATTVRSPRNAKLEHRDFRQDTARLGGGIVPIFTGSRRLRRPLPT
jgi:hypothetical protein